MKNKNITIVLGLVILFSLIGIYYFYSNKEEKVVNQNNKEIEQQEYILNNKFPEDIKSITISSASGNMEYIKTDINGNQTIWTIKDFEDIELNQQSIENIVLNSASIISDKMITENVENSSEYGLNPPQIILELLYYDGIKTRFLIGNKTPDKNYYYIMPENEKKVYIIDSIQCSLFETNLNDLIDKEIPKIDDMNINYINIIQEGKDEIEIKQLQNDNKENDSSIKKLTMTKPFNNISVYLSSLQHFILSGISEIELKDLIELFPKDLKRYGLDNPNLELKIKDNNNILDLKVGEKIDDNTFYCMINNRPHIFSIEKHYITPFIETNVMDYIERNIYKFDIKDIESINLSSKDENIKLEIKSSENGISAEQFEKFENETWILKSLMSQTENIENTDNLTVFANGKEIDAESFKNFFSMINSLSFDNISKTEKPSGEPKVIFTFNLKNGEEKIIKYYNYNENFYITEQNQNISFIINTQAVDNIFDAAKDFIS